MSTIVTRAAKGSPLTHAEVDANFTNLNTDKLEVGAAFNAAVAATPAVTANTAKVTNATHTGDVTGATALTIANDAVTNAKAANMATGTIKGRSTAGTGDPEDLTGAQATALLDVFGAAAKGLVPASGGGTTNFLRADGTFAAPPGGGGSPGGVSGELQYNNAGAFAGAADVEIEGGQLRFPAIATPAAPASGGGKLFGRSVGGRMLPAFMGPSGLDTSLQPHFGRKAVAFFRPTGNSTAVASIGFSTSVSGTATAASVTTTNRHTRMKRIEYLITTASTTAQARWSQNFGQYFVGGGGSGDGGFHLITRWGPATGVATATTRAFCGLINTNPGDVNPSSLINLCGMGWDAGDTNIQFIYNDGSGTATKVDLGASFPRPTADRSKIYEITMFSPPGSTQSVSYEVTDLATGAVATGTVTSDLPSTSTSLTPIIHMSVGGTSSVIGIAVMGVYIETDY